MSQYAPPGTPIGDAEGYRSGPVLPADDPGPGTRGERSWLPLLLGLIVALALIVLAWWLWTGQDDTDGGTQAVGLGEVLGDPDAFVGDRVAVSARIDALLTERAMTLGSDLVDGALLSLTGTDALINGYSGTTGVGPGTAAVGPGRVFQAGDYVQAQGTIRRFDRATTAEAQGLVLAPELFDAYQGQPVLLLDRLDVVGLGLAPEVPVDPEPAELTAILADPAPFAGKLVEVTGAPGEILGDRAFVLLPAAGSDGLLVVGSDTIGVREATTGAVVLVRGTVQAFDAAGFTGQGVELGDADLSGWTGRPAIIATEVAVEADGETTIPPGVPGSPPPATVAPEPTPGAS